MLTNLTNKLVNTLPHRYFMLLTKHFFFSISIKALLNYVSSIGWCNLEMCGMTTGITHGEAHWQYSNHYSLADAIRSLLVYKVLEGFGTTCLVCLFLIKIKLNCCLYTHHVTNVLVKFFLNFMLFLHVM